MSRPSPSIKGKEINSVKHLVKSPNDEFEEFITYVKVYANRKIRPGRDLVNLPTDEIVGVEQIVILGAEDLKAVYDMEWATASVIRVYMRYVCIKLFVHNSCIY